MRAFLRGYGIRSKILFLVSTLYLVGGLQTLDNPYAEAYLKTEPSFHAFARIFDSNSVVAILVGAGGLGILAALTHHRRAIQYAYFVLMMVSIFWTGLYVLGWLETGYWQTVFYVAQYAVLSGALLAASTVVELSKDHRAAIARWDTVIEIPEVPGS